MKSKTKSLIIAIVAASVVFILIVAIILTFVISRIAGIIRGDNQIEDTNGEDTSVVTLSSEDKDNDGYVVLFSGSEYRGRKTNVRYPYEEVDYDYAYFSFGKMSGNKPLQATKAKGKYEFEFSSTISEGNLEFFVYSNDELIGRYSANTEQTLILELTGKETLTIFAFAESAKGKIKSTRTKID